MTKLADLYCGLGQVSLSFARTLDKSNDKRCSYSFLVKPKQEKLWKENREIVQTSLFKRFFSSLNQNNGVWHALHQDSAFIPKKGKFVLTIHDLNFLKEKSEAKAQKRLKALQKKVDRADAVCFISEFAKKSAEEHLDINNKRVSVIYNGVPEISAQIKRPQLMSTRRFLFNIGVLMPKKNHEAIIRMMKYLPQYDLVIAGGGGSEAYRHKLRELVLELGLGERIFFSGFLSDEEKAYCLNNAEAFVFPSVNEGFGLPVVEAMSVGLPVFCSNMTSLPEVGGECAFYWENFDPKLMASLVSDKIDRFKGDLVFSEKLKKHAKQFSWEENVRAYVNLYADLILG